MSQAQVQLCDINGLGYAAMFVPALSRLSHNGVATGALHGALMSVFTSMARQPGAVPVILWDGRAEWRHEEYVEYKANRRDDPEKVRIREEYGKQVPLIQLMLTYLGVPQVRCANAEADDLAGQICREMDESWIIEMSTKDTDWFQGIKHNVYWYSPMSDQRIDLARLADPTNGLKDGHFLSPQEYVQAKALAGDDSDNIDGIEGVGLKTAVKIMRAHGGTIEDFWAACDAGMVPSGKVAQRVALPASREIYRRNLRLMDWTKGPAICTDRLAFTVFEPNWDAAHDMAEEYGLSKVMARAQEVLPKRRKWDRVLRAVDRALHAEHCQCLPA